MISVFNYDAYKAFLRDYVQALPRNGRGEMARIARALSMHPTRVSHIFHGEMNLTAEQACALCSHWSFGELESEYLMALVQLERAGTSELRRMTQKQLEKLRRQAKDLVHRVPREKILSEAQKAIFYSSWAYSATRMYTSIDGFNDVAKLAKTLHISREKMRTIIEFLLQTGLCVEQEGQLRIGPKTTHLESSSALLGRHHANWRMQAMQRHESLGEGELAYTCPVSLTRKDQIEIRERLGVFVSQFLKTVVASDPPETVACLNIDWFGVKS